MIDSQEPAIDGIEAVGDVRKQHGLGLLEQPGKGVGEHFIGAVADEDLVGLNPVIVSQRLAQARGARVRVEAERVGGG